LPLAVLATSVTRDALVALLLVALTAGMLFLRLRSWAFV
jgi:hypothetical protein